MITIDIRKPPAVDADPKVIQQINFTGNLDITGQATMLFIIEKVKTTILAFSQGTVKVQYFTLIYYQYKMTKYNFLNVKSSNSLLNKLKSGTENGSEVTSKIYSNAVGDSNDENLKL